MIDLHTHVIPSKFPKMQKRKGDSRWPQIEKAEEGFSNIVISGKVFRTVTDHCWNPLLRIQDMDKEDVQQQVLSVMPELMSYWAEPEDAVIFCRYLNESISKMVEAYPDRFIGLGTVPLQNPELAAKELELIKKEYRLTGVQIGTHVRGNPIGDPAFHVFFEEAEKLGLAIFVHPLHPLGEERIIGPPVLKNFVGFPSEIAFSVASVITGLVLEHFPNLRICFSHGGGGFGLVLLRLIQGWKTRKELREELPQSPQLYAEKLFFDTLVYDKRVFRYVKEIFSVNNLIVGSDYPFSIRESPPGKVVSDMSDLSIDEFELLRTRNAQRFLFG
ncbi:amidohydrolase [Pueribacillus theae]|uniref:2-amino-3-carboxymuconate-6-semialdehyde decarboxylase n=1 Tax=Pueribacillus theae TaxID=2171751 RepID=A0A2U1K354_9BACI|nr:amidohydrolase family protein [Pueribacillus theae]PWA11960.1 amidohydrolase [Pueribacillus theae]